MNGKHIFIAKSADLIGDVTIGNDTSIWYQAVVRGDASPIVIGSRTNIQDGSIVHGDPHYDTVIGSGVTIGHNCIIHGCHIGSDVLVGMGAIILNGATIGDNCLIGAGTLVTQNAEIPPNSLVIGSPGKVKRQLTDQELESIKRNAREYVGYMDNEKGRMYFENAEGKIVVREL